MRCTWDMWPSGCSIADVGGPLAVFAVVSFAFALFTPIVIESWIDAFRKWRGKR
jgi:hypothetical protein